MKDTLKTGIRYEHKDGIDLISKGIHERFIINKEKFVAKVSETKVSEKRKAHP
jgi:predicted thioesterase